MPPFSVILPAAGRSSRFGGDKLLAPLAGRPVLAHTLAAFLGRDDVDSVVIPTRSGNAAGSAAAAFPDAPAPLRNLLADPRVRVCDGGATRAESVRIGLRQTPRAEWVAVHDAARPLVSRGLIDRTLAAAVRHGAAVPAMPVALTVKQTDGPLPAPVQRTVPRQGLWGMQTPQIMRRDDLLAAFDAYEARGLPWDQVTDDAQLLELAGREVWLVEGEERNLKVTTALDLRIAEAVLAWPV
jgi:2-C-methyl-D-erythritol 4-phosphate cytidylyltransferase